jgi:hypothetical protein
MRKWVLLIVLLSALFTAMLVQAQAEITIQQLDINIWPEYDKPTALVIYNITLAPDTVLPATLTFQLPASLGEPNGFGYISDPNQPPIQQGYNYVVEGDIAYVTFQTQTTNAQLEYYDSGLTKNGSQRHYEFVWLGDYAVESLIVWVQQPLDASQVNTSPTAKTAVQGNKGLMVHPVDLGSVVVGETKQVSIDYTKDSDRLSIEGLSIEPVTPINQNTSGRVNLLNVLPWFLGILGVVLVVGGALWYWQTGREQPRAGSHRRRSRSTPKPRSTSISEEDAIYCHQCGKRAGQSDRFCRSCGTKLRSA